jgi:hypothetical protein
MRLLSLDDQGDLNLKEYDEDKKPPYAILSHTWDTDDDEVNFRDIQSGWGKSKAGYRKILFCGTKAAKDDLKHFWVDSCCIDRSNAVELSEAIVSMYRWYQRAAKCYVYLQDVSALKRDNDGESNWRSSFKKSRWFTRGCVFRCLS